MTTLYGTRYNVHSMLKKTVYFRTQADLDKFNAIDNKAEWLSNRLNDFDPKGMPDISKPKTAVLEEIERKYKPVKDPEPYRPTHYKPTASSTIQPAATVQDLGFKDTASAARAFKQNVGPTLQRTPKPSTFDKDIQFCPHGAVKGMCKKGCK